MSMRIIGGEYGGRHIEMPRVPEVRPTQDKVRQAVFNILFDVRGKAVIDLFAGSGAFGIEALSRGAAHAVFVDNNSLCINTIKKNLDSLSIPETSYDLIHANVLSVFSRIQRQERSFDLIFIDPPYYKNIARKCLLLIDTYDIVTPTGRIIAEHYKKDNVLAAYERLVFEKDRSYGDTVISFFRLRHEYPQDSGLPGDV